MRKIAIYGGTFDPVHKGHINVAKYVIEQLQLDELYFVPANNSPFKSKQKNVNSLHRINMLNQVLEEKMFVSDFEIKRGGTSYTIDTLKYFNHKFSSDQLYLIIGSDHLAKLDKWREIDKIAQLAQIVVIKRTKKVNKINSKKYKAIILNNPLWDFSSSEFKQGYLDSVDDKVLDYIQEHGLYLEKIVHSMVSALRAKHCMNTGHFAAEMAKKFNVDARKAYIAGILHDIAKEWDVQQSREYLLQFEPQYANVHEHELHQVCGYSWVKHQYKLKDRDILHAILVHTTLDDRTEQNIISPLDKILFISDKISPGRRFIGVQKLRELAFQDLDQAFEKVIEYVYNYNIQKGVKFTPRQEQIYRKYLK
ncbi:MULTISPECIES: nicotinate-nucleotide adenylyltransferase [unclassified Mycoplasma]|uniref:nicotinate-nucleotide adenylyltransferase n=1 Tax=unclassified Mycoplasma TaxID=2683645 RepID=UPI00211BA624|nr:MULTISPECIES: nicotinate-nucleotide adenylyltransferase [unclassified Mycoplasma]UUM19513.1 nicotinate-nucleotide adenylyltransferase [Mycoplasma sp. 1578d]UUM25136.1 nicotinate-nucleotide adenylyltransferase [Mycoplasma sp. 3686d]